MIKQKVSYSDRGITYKKKKGNFKWCSSDFGLGLIIFNNFISD